MTARELFDLLGPASTPWHVIVVASVLLVACTVACRPRTVAGRVAAILLVVLAIVLGLCETLFFVDHPIAGVIWWSRFIRPAVVLLVLVTAAIVQGLRQKERRLFTALASFSTLAVASVTAVPAILALGMPPN